MSHIFSKKASLIFRKFTLKKFLYFLFFCKIKFSGSNIKKILTFSQKKALFIFRETEFSYISGKGNPKKLLIFPKVTFRAQKTKKKLTGKKLLIFQEIDLLAPGLKNI